MSYSLRSILCNKIVQSLYGVQIGGRGLKPSSILPYLKVCEEENEKIEYELDFLSLRKDENNNNNGMSRQEWLSKFIQQFNTDLTIPGVYVKESRKLPFLKFTVSKERAIADTLHCILRSPNSFWKSSALFSDIPSKKIIIEFSSPNIAKPFHIGHLRSTIIGNFLSNIHTALGHKVIKLNYLGDWGLQYGLLKYGWDSKGMSEKDLEKDALRKLLKAYVWANKEAESNSEVNSIAREIFNKMEQNDPETLKIWSLLRQCTIKELNKVYKRLNITFDAYHGESMYKAVKCAEIIDTMRGSGLLYDSLDGRILYKTNKHITLVKSDGATLYITRDIAAAIHRFDNYNFDKMYYVVDGSQARHFTALFSILHDLRYSWADRLKHVSFGRILNMSTRKGQIEFLEDILDEARDLMNEKSEDSPYTKSLENDEVFDNLGASAVIAEILKSNKKSDFHFTWDPLQNKGVRLQYCHSRLCSLENSYGTASSTVNVNSLTEKDAVNLIRHIIRFDEVLLQSYQKLDTHILPIYLFKLNSLINRAWTTLSVKNSPEDMAAARFALFQSAKHTLAAGMQIMGLTPLNKI